MTQNNEKRTRVHLSRATSNPSKSRRLPQTKLNLPETKFAINPLNKKKHQNQLTNGGGSARIKDNLDELRTSSFLLSINK